MADLLRHADDARLDRLWNATRPDEPSPAEWDALWAKVTARLDAPPAPPIPMPAPAWKRYSVVAFTLAQAAALLIACGLLLPGRPSAPQPASVLAAAVDIEPGDTVLIRLDARSGGSVVAFNGDDGSNTIDDNLAMFNDVESMAMIP